MKMTTLITAFIVSLTLLGGLILFIILAIKKEKNERNGSSRNN